MSEAFRQTVSRLPDIMCRNAVSMMQRMLQAIQDAIGADPQLGATSFPALILRASSDDIVRHFDQAVQEAMGEVQQSAKGPAFSASGLMGLSIEPLEPEAANAESDFSSSTEAFGRLSARAKALGVRGLSACTRRVILGAFDEAFSKSQIGPGEAKAIMPFARRALNGELAKLYEKLASL